MGLTHKQRVSAKWYQANKLIIAERSKLQYQTFDEKLFLLTQTIGSQCLACGLEYTRESADLFDRHHIDPTQKKFGVGKTAMTRSEKSLSDEIKKCVLLCAFCHRREHARGDTVSEHHEYTNEQI